MDKLNAMSVFVAIAEQGSLTKAANHLGRSLPAVVRILAALEKDLSVRLFNRTTRKIALTEEGRIYLQNCRRILADVKEAEQLLIDDQQQPHGTITLTASVTFGEMYVNPAVIKFLKLYPHIRINLLLFNRVTDMLNEGIDLAIRIAHVSDSSMIAKPVGEIRQIVCASPEILKKHGTPERPEALSDLPCILFTGLSSGENWSFRKKNKVTSVKINGSYLCNQVESTINSCISGLGFGKFLCYQISPWVKRGDLNIVLKEFEPEPVPVNIVFHHSRLMAPRIRLFVDFLAEELKKKLAS